MDLSAELRLCTALAVEAGTAILAVKELARSTAVQKDGGQGPVTAADLAADRVVREGLRGAFPNDVIVTEETFDLSSLVQAGERVWFIDPLDGTEDFVAGTADYAVMIGLCVRGEPVMGVVHHPESRTTWRGDVPARRCERIDADGAVTALRVDQASALTAPPRVAISRSHPSVVTDFIVDVLHGVPVPCGSVGLKVALIVDGRADAYVSGSRRIKMWDTAGPQAIVLAAGGEMTALRGEPLRYTGEAAHGAGVCAWSPAAKGSLRETLLDAVRKFSRS